MQNLIDCGVLRWIPDGQLCPTVPNRSNYIHWIEDLLSSDIIPKVQADGNTAKGFDIGTGANCIYPLLGASLLGWKFVGSDVTDVALEWAEKNVKSNPHISELIEIRRVNMDNPASSSEELNDEPGKYGQCTDEAVVIGPSPPAHLQMHSRIGKGYDGPPILVGVVKDGETFDFCMCNPPFFETIEEAGLNPKTSCGGTVQEMVCPGGESAFIARIIEDSVQLRQSFGWYTSMVGRKTNLKVLISKLWEVGATIVKTTEFVQGQTCRWGLSWSFLPASKKIVPSHVAEKNNLSFMLEGLQRHQSAFDVLQSVESYFYSIGASSKLDSASFKVDVTLSAEQCNSILKTQTQNGNEQDILISANCPSDQLNDMRLRVSVFQQIPGTLLVKGLLLQKEILVPGVFSVIFQQLQEVLKSKFSKGIR
ncbi:ribosomal RNA large subunit methyltransferase F isoform X2 [Capsicum annuum]|uniref:ribosomal RNA large subunit methyltransferase F isoform X2 n=1 Tax=Capsicum annuum TaxID=4072 RepID=UPI001FB12866|nr:ribosomal RNA large subunit methyltransferase F isoform X2 [Capsicum annuum]